VMPRAGLDQLTGILRKRARFGWPGILAGHTILTIGVAMVLMPTLANIAAAAVLGSIVGALRVLNRQRAMLAVPMPVVAAALIAAIVFYAVRQGVPVDPLHALLPPLVTFLPGAMLALGMVELAYGDMISGSTRMIAGFVQLVLLAFGLAAGAALLGADPAELLKAGAQRMTLSWPWWVGVLVFGVGVYLHFSAPRNSLLWLLLVLLCATSAQRFAASWFGGEISGFFGMLVATPLSYLIHQRFRGPPFMVTFLPSFWVVVPGALGLLSVTRMLSDRTAGLESLMAVIFVVASVALGTLVGASLYKFLAEKSLWFGTRLQRVQSYLQHGDDR